MAKLSQAEKEKFLAALHVGILAIPQPGRGPLAAPIWYAYEPGGDAWVIIGQRSRKARLLKPGTPVSLCAQNEAPPYAYVSVEGAVTSIEPCTAEAMQAMAVRYLGEERGREYADNMPAAQASVVTFRPQTWLAVDFADAG